MKQYIAFLRGINVGGNNKLSMPELKAAWEAKGFSHVTTYINSGNIIFSSPDADELALQAQCEGLIAERFQLKIGVAVLSAESLAAALAHAPPWWNTNEESKHNAIIVIPPVSMKEVFDAVGEAKPEYEKVAYHGSVIFWSAPLKTFSRTRWSKVSGTSVYDNITIRNANTMNKLLLLTT